MGILHRVVKDVGARAQRLEAALRVKLGQQPPPLAVQWIATQACDLTCDHCYSHAGAKAAGELTTEEAKRLLIDPMAAMGCPSLVFAGGEPLLRKDFEELVRYAASRGVAWSLHAHGRLIPRLRPLLRDVPPQMAAISLDGPPAIHDALRGRVGAFGDALRAMEVLKETGCPEVVAGTTVNAQNADYIADMWPWVLRSAADGWGLHLFAPEGRGDAHRALVPSPTQLRRVAAFARRARLASPVEIDNEWGSAGAADLYYRSQRFGCSAGRTSCVVSATGEVMPCTTTDLAESQGNVRERGLIAAWRGGFAPFRRAGGCHDHAECWLQDRNGNPCSRAAFGEESPTAEPLTTAPAARPPRPPRPDPKPSPRPHITPQPTTPTTPTTPTSPRPRASWAFTRGVALALATLGLRGAAAQDPPPTLPPSSEACTTRPPSAAPTPQSGKFALHLDPSPPTPLTDAGTPWPGLIMLYGDDTAWHRARALLTELDLSTDAASLLRARAALDALRVNTYRWHRAPGIDPAPFDRMIDALTASLDPPPADASPSTHALTTVNALLDQAEAAALYDPWLVAWCFRRLATASLPTTPDPAASAAFTKTLGRLERFARAADAALRARVSEMSEGGGRPWMSKSAPPPGWNTPKLPPNFPKIIADTWAAASPTTWQSESFLTVEVTAAPPSATLWRRGGPIPLSLGDRFDLTRLDAVTTPPDAPSPLTLKTIAGDLTLPPGATLTTFNALSALSDADRARLSAKRDGAALRCDPLDQMSLQRALWIAHPLIRTQIATPEPPPGAPTLRLILALFDQ